jgi:hypothetical protein
MIYKTLELKVSADMQRALRDYVAEQERLEAEHVVKPRVTRTAMHVWLTVLAGLIEERFSERPAETERTSAA